MTSFMLSQYLKSYYADIEVQPEISQVIIKYDCSLYESCDLAVSIYRIQTTIQYFEGSQLILKVLSLIQKQFCCCEIYYKASIGSNFLLVHGLGTVIGPGVCVGNNVTVYQNVTLGTKYDTERLMCSIGNDVILYAGAKVLGSVDVGNGSVIGANSVVITNVGEKEIFAGVPAKKIGTVIGTKYKHPVGQK